MRKIKYIAKLLVKMNIKNMLEDKVKIFLMFKIRLKILKLNQLKKNLILLKKLIVQNFISQLVKIVNL